ncbi:MAG: hypothetical protein EOP04_16560 [Proteobacteria bacterium]|nr:MAG: hypothetical protein EOP04_16560 [Pseudomonadota bacterium]
MKSIPGSLLYFSFVVLVCLSNRANAQVIGNQDVYPIMPGTLTFDAIETAVGELYQGPLKKNLCQLMPNAPSISVTFGVTVRKAMELSNQCGHNPNDNTPPAKIFTRKYYIAPDLERRSKIQSWTTTYNHTVLFLDDEIDMDMLKKLIAHEIAISLDAKMNMMLPYFYLHEGLNSKLVNNTVMVTIPSGLSSFDERINNGLGIASYQPAAYAFATMRAMNVEAEVMGLPFRTVMDHNVCADTFKRLFEFFRDNEEQFRETSTSIPGMLSDIFSKNSKPANMEAAVAEVTDSGFLVRWCRHPGKYVSTLGR